MNMTMNSALLNKSDCLERLQEVESYLKKDQAMIEAAVYVLCDIGELVDRIEFCILTWRELSRLYQQAEFLLRQTQVFFGEHDTECLTIQRYIEAFEQARMATVFYIKEDLLKRSHLNELLQLGFPRRVKQTA